MQWEEKDNEGAILYDTLNAKTITGNVLDLDAGDECKAAYEGEQYDALILVKGEKYFMHARCLVRD